MKNQKGAALIVVLSLLAISLMVGLSSMQSSHIDESLAGNYRAQTQAQMAAEKSLSIGYFLLPDDEGKVDAGNFNVYQGSSWEDDVLSEGSTWVSCHQDQDDAFSQAFGDCKIAKGAYEFARIEPNNGLGLGAGYYVVGKGVLLDTSGSAISESLPVFAKLLEPFSIKSALTVLGGIEGIEGNKWYPSSDNAKISDGGVEGISAVYYEGDAHSCEEESDPQACYQEIQKSKEIFDGDVVYGGLESDTGSSTKMSELYHEIKNSAELVTKESDLDFKKKKDACTEDNSQFAFVKSFVISGSDKFCGVVIVWGGVVDIPADATINGNASVEGLMIAANFGENADGSPDFENLGTVSLAINGGGEKGSVFFDDSFVKSAFGKVGASYEKFVGSAGFGIEKKITSWN